MGDAQSLGRDLSTHIQKTFDEFLNSVRSTELRVEKAARWIDMPLPTVDVDHLNLDITPDDPQEHIQTMYELIYLAFKTHSTRVAIYMIAKELGDGMGLKHGQYLDYAGAYRGGWAPGDTEPYKLKSTQEDLPLSNLYVTMLQRLGVETETFADNTGTISEA